MREHCVLRAVRWVLARGLGRSYKLHGTTPAAPVFSPVSHLYRAR